VAGKCKVDRLPKSEAALIEGASQPTTRAQALGELKAKLTKLAEDVLAGEVRTAPAYEELKLLKLRLAELRQSYMLEREEENEKGGPNVG
jgi:hypothetical protein